MKFKNLMKFTYFKNWERIYDISNKYLWRGKFIKYLKLQTYLYFYPLRSKYVWIFAILVSVIFTYLESQGLIQ